MLEAMSQPAVLVRDLHKSYGAKRAVNGLNLQVEQGEIFAVLGPNGAGKTTTVEICEGYRTRDSGTVEILGVDPQSAGRDWRSRIGVVLQSNEDHAEFTVQEMVAHFAQFYPRARDVDEVIDAVGLRDKAKARTHALSGGQRRRMDVALGIIGQPELLFLDEPTTGFDPEARRSFWDLVSKLRDEGTTVLLTTHYMDEAEHLADRIAIVRDGSVVALDTPAAIGARAQQQATVRWDDGHRHEEHSTTPTALVADLAARYGGEVPGLEVYRPTLEDVYLELVEEDPR
jgi:ABC-2 type transport system ATP-binding protein